jgi:hypothetical protein
MAGKLDPRDWDRLFAPSAPRHGGPLRVLGNLLITGVVIALIVVGGYFAIQFRERQVTTAIAQATSGAATRAPLLTSTAGAQANERETTVVLQTSTASARLTPQSLGFGSVVQGGNMRSEPIIADPTLIGLVWPGDQVEFLSQSESNGQVWYYIRITKVADNRTGEGVDLNQEGWVAASLLSPIEPAPSE